MDRFFQSLLIASTLGLSWLAMMAVHEFGHVLAAWTSGGSVEKVILNPFTFSQTILADNPHPHFVAWGGPLIGCAIPLLLLAAIRWTRWPIHYLFSFYAGFCLIANGAYIGGGSFIAAGDAGDLLRHGSPQWLLIAFGIGTATVGLWLWHGLGPCFGLGSARGRVNRRHAAIVLLAFAILFAAELFYSEWLGPMRAVSPGS